MHFPTQTKRLNSYSGFNQNEIQVFEPQTLGELKDFVKYCYANQISYGMKGNGLSFEDHFMHPDYVISTQKLNDIQFNPQKGEVIAQPGATWGAIARELLQHGFVPKICPTTSSATVGGSLSCNTYSRMTSSYGRESNTIKELTILMPNGKVVYCNRAKNARVFHAVIGSYGYVGIVLSVTYEALKVGKNPAFQSITTHFDELEGLKYLNPDNHFDFQKVDYPGTSSIIFRYKDRFRAMIPKHKWVNTEERNRVMVHRNNYLRIFGDFLILFFPKFAAQLWNTMYKKVKRHDPLISIDDPFPAMFFMDMNIKGKKIHRALGGSPKLLQQSFVIPGSNNNLSEIYEFIENSLAKVKEYNLHPSMIDLGYIPPEATFGLSASPENEGSYIFTIALDGKACQNLSKVKKLFEIMSKDCCNQYNGKVHLTKNVCCDKDLLINMYADELDTLTEIKQQFDPHNLLTNAFIEKLFGKYIRTARQQQEQYAED